MIQYGYVPSYNMYRVDCNNDANYYFCTYFFVRNNDLMGLREQIYHITVYLRQFKTSRRSYRATSLKNKARKKVKTRVVGIYI